MRFQVNPLEKGKFRYVVNIFTSDAAEAHQLILTGNLLEMPVDANAYLTACPDFNSHPAGMNPNQFNLTVVTIDKTTREKLAQTKVKFIQNGLLEWSANTDKNGKIKKSGIIGLAYFSATHDGYRPAERGAFVSNDRNEILLELEKLPNAQPETPKSPVTTPKDTISNSDFVVEIIDKQPNQNDSVKVVPEVAPEPIVSSTPKTDSVPNLATLEETNFDAKFFQPVNVVFVMDVSNSMREADKLELMKYSVNQLSNMIRSSDKISLVKYATVAKVLLPPTTGMDKAAVQEQIKKLKAGGMTAGGEGIKLGFEQAKDGFLPDGVNQVFVITDGAFSEVGYNFKKMFRPYTQKGIRLSVVGILNDAKSEQSMREVAKLGNGEYIPVFNLQDATKNIPQAIRKLAFKSQKKM